MSAAGRYVPKTALGRFVHAFEESAIALMLGLMVLLTFTNVVLRYVFNSLNIWSLEVVSILFAWLVMFGIAYGFKVTAHLGVDVALNMVSPRAQRVLGLVAGAFCIVYALLLLKGAWDYWAPFAALPRTDGHWFPTGFAQTRNQAYTETGQVPMLDWLRWLEPLINEDERYSKLPVVIPYFIIPLASLLILFRIVQATFRILRGETDRLIVSHEAEDAVEEAAAAHREA